MLIPLHGLECFAEDAINHNGRASVHVLAILCLVLREGEIGVADIAERLSGSRETTGPRRSLKTLEAMGYLDIMDAPVRVGRDSPKKLVRVSDHGLRRLEVGSVSATT